ncbi:ATP-dependent protease HslVU, ATPase subunit [Sphaerochaeta pleomorpha str. Grapes]|uniref:ATP-dependent protease ATPase subunit HslU n=1 Tax=Sphaerochaeta pleomorpha (strain ATCC BAA-1885 / DSM 22778 / Grapes) TaxID=158190 RepID=G8QXD2_SPHPG|nr:ATP-dependent protease ATPase subunit HslU [Sphaerochaeta pleomorpha]AEV28433.1 ATP-dependent protease HslVU, ATPase subunit [Sphaerochaeta pleomorpha str. Grapes]
MEYISTKKLDEMKPSQIVKELDKYIIGQNKAKRTIAVAIRNRTRRKRLPDDIRDEVSPKNIIMIGPTGVGKTEIARRIAKLSNAPFIKVEATKYTEVGYVGRDVESIIRDLMSIAVQQVKAELAENQTEAVSARVEERLLDLLLPSVRKEESTTVIPAGTSFTDSENATREKFRQMLRDGKFDDREVEVNVQSRKQVGIEVLGQANMDDLQDAMQSLGSIFGNSKGHNRKLTVKRAREIFTEEETEKAVDNDRAIDEAKERVEQMGIVFLDEIDKVASAGGGGGNGPDVSREGVQRDILPIVEGTNVNTKWGVIDTTHILFIASGAFHVAKPSDLIPELQGRFPLRVELDELTADDFYRILTEPANAITMQYRELLKTEGVDIVFSDEAIKRISEIAYEVNNTNDNIGARRLFTVMEKLLEELSFSADELSGQQITITDHYVDERLSDVIQDQDLSKFIL